MFSWRGDTGLAGRDETKELPHEPLSLDSTALRCVELCEFGLKLGLHCVGSKSKAYN